MSFQMPTRPVTGHGAADLRGVEQRSYPIQRKNWQDSLMNAAQAAPKLGAPARLPLPCSIKLSTPANPPNVSEPQLVGEESLRDRFEPDRLLGRDVNVPVIIGPDTVGFIVRNAERGLRDEQFGIAPRLDARVSQNGKPVVSFRVTPDTNTASVTGLLGNERRDVLFGATFSPSQQSQDNIHLAGYSGHVGINATMGQASRFELIGTPGGKTSPNGGSYSKDVEAYGFGARDMQSQSVGLGVRINGVDFKLGKTPVNFLGGVEGAIGHLTGGKDGAGGNGFIEATIGKGDTTVTVEADGEKAAQRGSSWGGELLVRLQRLFGGAPGQGKSEANIRPECDAPR